LTCAEAVLLKAFAKLSGEFADVARDGLRGADRLGEGAARLPSSAPKRSAKGARLSEQVADLVEAKHPEALDPRGRKSQGRNRQRRDIVRCFPGLGHKACPPAETRQGVGRASAVAARARKPTPASSSTSVASITGSPPWR